MKIDEKIESLEYWRARCAPGRYRRGIGSDCGKIFDGNGSMIATDCSPSAGSFFVKIFNDFPEIVADYRRLKKLVDSREYERDDEVSNA